MRVLQQRIADFHLVMLLVKAAAKFAHWGILLNANNLQFRGLKTYQNHLSLLLLKTPIQNLVILRTIKTRLLSVTTIFDVKKPDYSF